MASAYHWLLLALLLTLTHAQTTNLGDLSYYTLQNQSYLNIYGSGAQPASTLGDRNISTTTAGPQVVTVTAAPTGPAPVQINCPFNQVYDNFHGQAVCIIGSAFEGPNSVPMAVLLPSAARTRPTAMEDVCVPKGSS